MSDQKLVQLSEMAVVCNLPRGLGIQWTTTAAWLSQDKWLKVTLLTSWMACFPTGFQFKEQSVRSE